jgi:hypothetical protein
MMLPVPDADACPDAPVAVTSPAPWPLYVALKA